MPLDPIHVKCVVFIVAPRTNHDGVTEKHAVGGPEYPALHVDLPGRRFWIPDGRALTSRPRSRKAAPEARDVEVEFTPASDDGRNPPRFRSRRPRRLHCAGRPRFRAESFPFGGLDLVPFVGVGPGLSL